MTNERLSDNLPNINKLKWICLATSDRYLGTVDYSGKDAEIVGIRAERTINSYVSDFTKGDLREITVKNNMGYSVTKLSRKQKKNLQNQYDKLKDVEENHLTYTISNMYRLVNEGDLQI